MNRLFSTTASAARAAIKFVWKGTEAKSELENMIENKFSKNPKLDKADVVEIAGEEHTSDKDPELRVSGQIYKEDTRLTSFHLYFLSGIIEYSKEAFNKSQGK